jgi:hypothetical protein
VTTVRFQRVFRGVAAAVAFATFASPLLETFHQASVRHIVCPEDGELIDAPVEAAHRHARVPRDGASLFSEHDPSGPGPTDGRHDHCAIALRGHLRAREESRKAYVLHLVGANAPKPAHEPERLSSLALYRLAPKASPPLV